MFQEVYFMTRNIYGTYIDSSIDNPLILKQEITIILLNIYFLSLKDNKKHFEIVFRNL